MMYSQASANAKKVGEEVKTKEKSPEQPKEEVKKQEEPEAGKKEKSKEVLEETNYLDTLYDSTFGDSLF